MIKNFTKSLNDSKNENKNLTNEVNKLRTDSVNTQKRLNDMNNENKKLKDIIKDKEIEINKINEESSTIQEFNDEKKQNDKGYITHLREMDIFKESNFCVCDSNNSIFTTKGDDEGATYAIIQRKWSKLTNNGVHKIKLKCLQSALNSISIGMITNNKIKTTR
eukprot:479302_1